MKIKDILTEDYKDAGLDWVKEHCSEAIDRYKKGHIIYRGDKTTIYLKQFVLMTPRDNPREAAHAPYNLHNDIINNSKEFAVYPKREIIMTTDDYKADAYGGSKICLPVNGANIGVVPDEDIFIGFDRIVETHLGMFYGNLKHEFLPLVKQWTKGSFMTMESTNSLFQDIQKNASQEEIEDFINSLEEMRSNAPLVPLVPILSECMRKGNGNPLFSLFTSEGFERVYISQFESKKDRELWTDSPVVLLNPEDIELLT